MDARTSAVFPISTGITIFEQIWLKKIHKLKFGT